MQVEDRTDVMQEASGADSQRFFSDLILQCLGAGVIMTNRDGRITVINPAAEEITGWSGQEARGRLIADVFALDTKEPPVSSPCVPVHDAAGKPSMQTGMLVTRTDRMCTVSCNESTVYDRTHTAIGTVYVFRDVSQERQLNTAAQQLATIVQSTHDAIIGTTLDGIITSWNRGAELIYGYTMSEIVGHHMSRLAPKNRRGEFMQIIDRIKRGEIVGHFETNRLRKDGTRIYVSITTSALRDASGTITGFSTISQDITERKQAERRLKMAAHSLKLKNEELKQFAYIASHDLQEPLRMVSSYVQLLRDRYEGKLDDEADEFIRYAVDGSNRMQQLINDLLAYSRTGSTSEHRDNVDIEKVFDRVTSDLHLMIKEHNADITHDPLPMIEAYESQLSELFLNLISNAIKFHGETPPHVHVSAVRQDDVWAFSVRDNGIGIDPKYFDRIFVIFQRLHTRREYSGTGIGLAICKKIVDHHGGQIRIESKPGEGSVFSFTIPDPG
jgi:PAS domain S-box-containing protein